MSDSASTQISLWFAVNFLMFDCLFVSLPVFFFFCLHLEGCGTSPASPAVETRSLNHWITREDPQLDVFLSTGWPISGQWLDPYRTGMAGNIFFLILLCFQNSSHPTPPNPQYSPRHTEKLTYILVSLLPLQNCFSELSKKLNKPNSQF